MEPIKVKIVNRSGNPLPEYATPLSAGVDLRSSSEEDIFLWPGDRKLIPTGLFLEIPEGNEGQVRPRSGLAIKHGITVLNAPGTIDADYRGEVKVILANLGNDTFTITKGERIAQLIFTKVEKATFVEVESLEETERGEGGFGHTGTI